MSNGGAGRPYAPVAVRAGGTWIQALGRTRSPLVALGVCALVAVALTTPGFVSAPSLLSLINTAAPIGCVAVGMAFITLSGNIMSFALGATVGVVAITSAALSGYGLAAAVLGGMVVGIVFNVIQGLVIGLFRANAIIVSIAALALMGGLAEFVTGSHTVYAAPGVLDILRSKLWGIPVGGLVCLAAAVVGQAVLRYTQFGQKVMLLGSNLRAAAAAGVRTWMIVVITYALAGFFSSLAGILIAGRYGAGTIEYGAGYDYSAIAGVLVGGTSIIGGEGSITRSIAGVIAIAVVATILLLRGFDTQFQYFVTGVIVLGAVLLQGKFRR